MRLQHLQDIDPLVGEPHDHPILQGHQEVDACLAQLCQTHQGKVAQIRYPQGPFHQRKVLQETLALMTAAILQQRSLQPSWQQIHPHGQLHGGFGPATRLIASPTPAPVLL